MVLIFTGNGKGKTTAAIGLCIRALGWQKKVCMIQFLKSPDFKSGEIDLLKKMGVELYQTGIGFSWKKTPQLQIESIKYILFIKNEVLYIIYQLYILFTLPLHR